MALSDQHRQVDLILSGHSRHGQVAKRQEREGTPNRGCFVRFIELFNAINTQCYECLRIADLLASNKSSMPAPTVTASNDC